MHSLVNITPRGYQESIFETCKNKNTLVILPTGIGKTLLSILLTIHRLNQFPNSKALICSPTKPLCNQHLKTFMEKTTIEKDKIILYTGMIKPEEREKIFQKATVIIATPQTIEKDLENNRISLKNFSVLTIDEAHRSRMDYANTAVAKYYFSQAENPRLLALTASPGASKEKIDEIMKNLSIEVVEIRTEKDETIKQYIQEKKITWIEVELPKELNDLAKKLQNVYKERIKKLRNFGITKPSSIISKKDLIMFQSLMQREIRRGNNSAFAAISLIAQCLKLSHAIELLETQGLKQFNDFMSKLSEEKTKAAKSIMSDKEIQETLPVTLSLIERNVLHPKLIELKSIVRTLIQENKDTKIMVFANYRNTVKEIVSFLKDIPGINPVKLLGQKEGITQKKQLQTINDFEQGKYNVLIGTSIMEEGIDILGGAETAIFYDAVPSEIRRIQRSGRVGRTKSGSIICLITKDTRDEAYRWVSYRKEKKMHDLIKDIQDKGKKLSEF